MSKTASRQNVLKRLCGMTEVPQTWPSGIPILMDNIDACWLIVGGEVDVFYCPVLAHEGAEEQSVRRYHVMRIAEGCLLFGAAPDERLIVVPSRSVTVLSLKRSALFTESLIGADRQIVSNCVDDWFEGLAAAIRSDVLPQKSTVLLGDEKQLEFESKVAFQSAGQVVWIESQTPVLLNDSELLKVCDLPFPIAGLAWLTAEKEGTLDSCLTPDMVTRETMLQCFDSARMIYLQSFMAHIDEDARKSVQQMLKREDQQKNKVSLAVSDLVEVVEQQAELITDLSSDPLIAACQYVATNMDIHIKTPQGGSEALAQSRDPLGVISRVSGFRTRMVKLSGEWWKDNESPFLGFLEKDSGPCAIISDGKGKSHLIDPVKKTSVEIDKNVAAKLLQHAFMFYSPLSKKITNPMDMLRIGLKGRGRDCRMIFAMAMFTGMLSMATPLVTEQVMAKVIPEAQFSQLWVLGIALIVVALSSTLFSLMQSVAVLRIEGMMDNRLQSALWDRLLRLPSSFFRDFTVGDLVNRAEGVDAIRKLFTSSAVSSLIAAVTGIFSLMLMFYYDVQLALAVATLSIGMAVFTLRMGRKAVEKNKEYLERRGDIMTDVLQYLNAISKLRVCGVESDVFSLWATKYSLAERVNMEQKGKMNAVAVANSLFTFIAIASVLLVVALQGDQLFAFFSTPKSWQDINSATLTHVMSAAAFIAFNAAYGQFSSAVGQLANQGIALSMIKPLYDRLQPILEADEENNQACIDPGELTGAIEVNDVHFRYCKDTPLVLRGLSLKIEPRSFVALVGPSGAGKSSLIRLLLAFDAPESGSVFLDGKDITQLETQALRRNFGVVLQNGQLFAGSVFDNITAGSNLSMDDAWWAARMAGFDKDIENMPMVMHTVLSEGAGTLSGGQRQRLMIARAIINRPKVLIFDEATSALDNETQAVVSKSLETLNCTRIAIAHRLSTVRKADNIFVVDAGRVVESGNYDLLMAKQGIFYNLAQRQIA